MPGIEPGAFHMQSERSTAELHPQFIKIGVYGITGQRPKYELILCICIYVIARPTLEL